MFFHLLFRNDDDRLFVFSILLPVLEGIENGGNVIPAIEEI